MPAKPRTNKQYAASARNWKLRTLLGAIALIRPHAAALLSTREYDAFNRTLNALVVRQRARNKAESTNG